MGQPSVATEAAELAKHPGIADLAEVALTLGKDPKGYVRQALKQTGKLG